MEQVPVTNCESMSSHYTRCMSTKCSHLTVVSPFDQWFSIVLILAGEVDPEDLDEVANSAPSDNIILVAPAIDLNARKTKTMIASILRNNFYYAYKEMKASVPSILASHAGTEKKLWTESVSRLVHIQDFEETIHNERRWQKIIMEIPRIHHTPRKEVVHDSPLLAALSRDSELQ